MTETQERLGYEILADKRIVAAFVRPEVGEEVVEKFQEEYAKGRDLDWTWVVHPTRSYAEEPIDKLMDLAVEQFKDPDTGYYPYFIVIVDKRTVEDGSVLLVQRDPNYPPQWELRITPRSLATFFNICDIGHTTIEGVLVNDNPDYDESWVHDVPFDHTEECAQENKFEAVGLSQVRVGEGVTTEWFGAVPARVLVMGGEYDGVRKEVA